MKRFFWWITLFFILLVSIPFFALLNQMNVAKFIGVITVVTLSIALWIWKKQSANLSGVKNRVRLNLNDRFWLNQNCPFYTSLSKQDKIVFTDRVGLFLGSNSILHDSDLVLTKEDYFAIASSYVIANWQSYDILANANREVFITSSLNMDKDTLLTNDQPTRMIANMDDVLTFIKLYPSSTSLEKSPWSIEK